MNEKLSEEITDRILAQVLQEELSEADLKQVFTREWSTSQQIKNEKAAKSA